MLVGRKRSRGHAARADTAYNTLRTLEAQNPVAYAVDIKAAQQRLKPIYEQLRREAELVPQMGAMGRAVIALDRLMNAPNTVALSTADGALGELKAVLRNVDEPWARANGVLSDTVRSLSDEVTAAAQRGGQGAFNALMDGRRATVDKYAASNFAGGAGSERAAQIAKQIIAPDNTGIQVVRDLQKHAPGTLPEVGRALLEDIMEPTTAKGGFTGAETAFTRWRRVGLETKKALFAEALKANPAYLEDLDNFFLAATRALKHENSSNSANVGAGMVHMGNVVTLQNPGLSIAIETAGGLGSLLARNPTVVKLLTKGLLIPVKAPAAATANTAAIMKALEMAQGPSRAQGSGPVGRR